MNFASGGIDTGGNVRCLGLWGQFCAPFLQGLHFSFGFGSLIAPIIAAPFLSHEENELVGEEKLNVLNLLRNTTDSNEENQSKIEYAYLMFGIFAMSTAVFALVLYCIERNEKTHTSNERKAKMGNENQNENQLGLSFKYKLIIITLSVTIFLFNIGTEIGFARLLTTFAVYYDLPGLNKQIGAYMTSAFFIGFTFFRCAAIFMVHFFGLRVTILTCSVLIVVSNAVLVLFSNSIIGLWIGVIMSGFGTSPLFPTMYVLIDEYVSITSKISSLFTIGYTSGEFVIPIIISLYIKEFPMFLMYTTVFVSFFCVILIVGLFLIFRRIDLMRNPKILNRI